MPHPDLSPGTKLRMGRLLIFVTDLEEAVHFYRDVLGLSLGSQTPDRVTFAGNGLNLDAFRCESAGDWESHASQAGSAFAFEVDSIDAVVSYLEARGVAFLHREVTENELGRYIAFRDPFGVVHELFEPTAG